MLELVIGTVCCECEFCDGEVVRPALHEGCPPPDGGMQKADCQDNIRSFLVPENTNDHFIEC